MIIYGPQRNGIKILMVGVFSSAMLSLFALFKGIRTSDESEIQVGIFGMLLVISGIAIAYYHSLFVELEQNGITIKRIFWFESYKRFIPFTEIQLVKNSQLSKNPILILKTGEKIKIGFGIRLISGNVPESQVPGYALGGRAGEMINLKNELEKRIEAARKTL